MPQDREPLSDRDWEVIKAIAEHRYLTSRQVEVFCFAGHATPLTAARVCRRVLRRLHQLHVIAHLERHIGGVRAGSASFIWRIGAAGGRLLHDSGLQSNRARRHEPGRLFLEHCIAVADAHIALVREHRAGAIELIEVQTEPTCWRRYAGLGGAQLTLQPDLYVVTGAGNFEDRWFVEVDRGTESTPRIVAKCNRYEAYRDTGAEQVAGGGGFPLVVWVARDAKDAERIERAIMSDASLTHQIYRVTTVDEFSTLIREGAV